MEKENIKNNTRKKNRIFRDYYKNVFQQIGKPRKSSQLFEHI
jgi:hypothetical protein